MEKIPIGQLFRTKREAIGWSQERTSEGICSVPTLSRIENGERMPSERHVRALMERLGIEDNRSMVLQGPYEEKLEDLQTEARAQTIRFPRLLLRTNPPCGRRRWPPSGCWSLLWIKTTFWPNNGSPGTKLRWVRKTAHIP